MHIELLVEDSSGKTSLDLLLPKVIGERHTFRVHAYKGIGRIPKNMKDAPNSAKRILLANLPKLLKGYGRTFREYAGVVIVVCDLDDKDADKFRDELLTVLNSCSPKPDTRFCFAIEEGEAWFLGDLPAVKSAYPHADDRILSSYENDSICGTWEKLADAIFRGGAKALARQGWQRIGAEKFRWAEQIAPHMDVERNKSPSFQAFRDELRSI